MARRISDLPIGALVKDPKTKYKGKPIIFRIIDKNHAGYPSNSVTIMTDKIISLKSFDAREPGNPDTHRANYGNNRYVYSNIKRWLNSDQSSWYSSQHRHDQKPDNNNVWDNKNEYDTEPGFLTNFSSDLYGLLMTTSLTAAKADVDSGGTESFSDKIFLASCTEMGLSGDRVCGSHFTHFNTNEKRQAKPTPECVSNSEYTNYGFSTTQNWSYWLRDANTVFSHYSRVITTDGSNLHNNAAYNGFVGIRPLCNLPSSILVSDSTDSDGAYSIIFNRPPTKPDTIDVPDTIKGGSTAQISWATASDDDNNLAGYILEKQVDNAGGYSQIYKGASRNYVDNIQSGLNSVRYRVKAYDTANAMSEYETSPLKTVINNTPPNISGSNENLGTKIGPFSKGYTVTDVDAGQQLTVVETIDGKQKRSYTAESGGSQTFDVTLNEWREMLNGAHEMKVNASDGMGGSVERVYNFTKNEKEIELTLSSPLPADDIITKAIVSITGEIPLGATMEVFVCNNGNDPSPSWEDVSSTVKSGGKIFFSNKTKTAAKWGFNIKVKVKRNAAVGEIYIAGIGGNFE